MDAQVGDAVTWKDTDVEPPVTRYGAVTQVLSMMYLVICTDGHERFVFKRNGTLRRYSSESVSSD